MSIRRGVAPPAVPRAPQLADGMPNHPAERFLIAFLIFTPVFWLVIIGYGPSTASSAVVPALVMGLFLALLATTGKRTLGFLLKFFFSGGI